jgi:hypothetical protein
LGHRTVGPVAVLERLPLVMHVSQDRAHQATTRSSTERVDTPAT